MARVKLPLLVLCGCSAENKRPAFWALDTSDTRLFVVPENTRVDVLTDMLFDFIGKEYTDAVTIKPIMLSKRGEQIVSYIKRKVDSYVVAQQSDGED